MNSLLFVCLVAVAIGIAHADEPEKIVGGEDAVLGEFPYTVSIRNKGSHFCGGTIIGPKHILTAAHCLFPFRGFGYDKLNVLSGTNNVSSGGEYHSIAEMYYPQIYIEGHQWHNDIGIVKLTAPINFNAVQQSIELPTSPPPENKNVVISGWGLLENNGKLPNILQKLVVKSLTREDCQSRYRGIPIHENMFCTLRDTGFGACTSDSGGPLVYGNQIHGIVSGGAPCARGYPDVFTSVYHHLDYIRETMTL